MKQRHQGYPALEGMAPESSNVLEDNADPKKKDISKATDAESIAAPGIVEETSLFPGEALLVDETHQFNRAHGKGNIVLYPTPSNHPSDPLNWSTTRRWTNMLIIGAWCFIVNGSTSSTSVTYGGMLEAFPVGIGYLNNATAGLLFLMGAFNFLTNPIVDRWGIRPVYLGASFMTSMLLALCAAAPNAQAWVAGRVLLGLAAAPSEQLPARSANDMFFVHERGLGLSVYMLCNAMGSFLTPVPAGFIVAALGWRWVYGMLSIVAFAVFLVMAIFLEESSFERSGLEPAQINADGTRALAPFQTGFWKTRRIVTSMHPNRGLWQSFIGPLKLLQFPIIVWSALVWGVCQPWLLFIAMTTVIIFEGPTYRFNADTTGLTMLAPMVGAVFGVWLGGAATDRFLIWRARRNEGMMVAESRLFGYLVCGPIFAGGLLLYGLGYHYQLHYMVPIVGMAIIGVGLTLSAEASLSYALECYPALAGDVTVISSFIRNSVVGAMTFALQPWITALGIRDAFITAACIAVGVCATSVVFITLGRRLRRWSAPRYYKYAKKMEVGG